MCRKIQPTLINVPCNNSTTGKWTRSLVYLPRRPEPAKRFSGACQTGRGRWGRSSGYFGVLAVPARGPVQLAESLAAAGSCAVGRACDTGYIYLLVRLVWSPTHRGPRPTGVPLLADPHSPRMSIHRVSPEEIRWATRRTDIMLCLIWSNYHKSLGKLMKNWVSRSTLLATLFAREKVVVVKKWLKWILI